MVQTTQSRITSNTVHSKS